MSYRVEFHASALAQLKFPAIVMLVDLDVVRLISGVLGRTSSRSALDIAALMLVLAVLSVTLLRHVRPNDEHASTPHEP